MKRPVMLLSAALALLLLLSGCQSRPLLSPEEPVVLSLWHVYGEQADSPMNRLVEEFNDTLGREQGVVLNVTLMTNSFAVGEQLLEARAGAVGSPDFPDLFFCHTGNAAALGADTLVDWNSQFSREERAAFVDSFWEEGVIDGRSCVLPVSKSTHLLFLNRRLFDRFSADTGVTADDLADWPGFFSAAEQYALWSGGQPFCALDFPLRAVELNAASGGTPAAMTGGWYDFSDPALRASWMEFARALVQGHILVSDLYANTQIMTGQTAAGLGSSASLLYYNDTVTYDDHRSEPLELTILPMPRAAGGKAVTTQAGVGLCAARSTPEKEAAAALFARWLTQGERNLDFVAETGYMPVTAGAFDAIGDYPFPDRRYEDLYRTLRTVGEEFTPMTEPDAPGYYARVNRLYDALRERQPDWVRRCRAGADPEELAEESWALFRSIT